MPAEVLVARSVALRVVKGEHRKGGKRGGRATRAESVLLRAVERFRARRADSMHVEPPSRAGGRTQAHAARHGTDRGEIRHAKARTHGRTHGQTICLSQAGPAGSISFSTSATLLWPLPAGSYSQPRTDVARPGATASPARTWRVRGASVFRASLELSLIHISEPTRLLSM